MGSDPASHPASVPAIIRLRIFNSKGLWSLNQPASELAFGNVFSFEILTFLKESLTMFL